MIIRFLLIVAMLVPTSLLAAEVQTSAGKIKLSRIAQNLEEPWGFGFLPDGGILVTERDGNLVLVDKSGRNHKISGLPRISEVGQGGLLDILIPEDFSDKKQIFLTFSDRQGTKFGTAILRAQFDEQNLRLTKVKTIFRMSKFTRAGRHFGSRIVEASDGTLFFTIGDRADRPSAQDLRRHNGSIIHINKDGTPASNNPKLSGGAKKEIWSYGHRNPQGLAFDLEGQLWAVEHGARGGDEVNKIKKGANYGWPIISYGRHYTGGKIGEGTHKAGMEQPEFYWDPSIAPSGMMFYSGKLWPEWKGSLFIGSLKFDYISRLSGIPLNEVEQISAKETGRVRDVREGPDGTIYFLSVYDGALFRMTPAR